jgi:hypothetical protein
MNLLDLCWTPFLGMVVLMFWYARCILAAGSNPTLAPEVYVLPVIY